MFQAEDGIRDLVRSRGLGDVYKRQAQRAVLRNPVLWCYGASYCTIKFIRYALLFWLPYFLAKKRGYGEEQAGYVSTAFEVGGVVGVITLGIASDRLKRYSRSLLSAVGPVSYTHLTLPTSALVEISVVAVSFKKKNMRH